MKTSLDLLNEITAYGFDQQKTLICIDRLLDSGFGIGYRRPLSEEELPEELYEDILELFAGRSLLNVAEIEQDAKAYAMEGRDRKRGQK